MADLNKPNENEDTKRFEAFVKNVSVFAAELPEPEQELLAKNTKLFYESCGEIMINRYCTLKKDAEQKSVDFFLSPDSAKEDAPEEIELLRSYEKVMTDLFCASSSYEDYNHKE